MNIKNKISNRKPQVIMLCGMTGSGKTTLATKLEHELPAICFSIDRWMIELYGHHMNRKDFDLRMAIVKKLIWKTVKRLIALDINVILDYGFWLAKERIEVSSEIRNIGGIPVIYFMNAPLKILKQRLNKRNESLPTGTFEITEEMLNMFMIQFEPPTAKEGIEIVEFTPSFESKAL